MVRERLMRVSFLVVAAALALGGCVVAPGPGPAEVVRACPPPYHWIPGHYGPYGGFHPGHCG